MNYLLFGMFLFIKRKEKKKILDKYYHLLVSKITIINNNYNLYLKT